MDTFGKIITGGAIAGLAYLVYKNTIAKKSDDGKVDIGKPATPLTPQSGTPASTPSSGQATSPRPIVAGTPINTLPSNTSTFKSNYPAGYLDAKGKGFAGNPAQFSYAVSKGKDPVSTWINYKAKVSAGGYTKQYNAYIDELNTTPLVTTTSTSTGFDGGTSNMQGFASSTTGQFAYSNAGGKVERWGNNPFAGLKKGDPCPPPYYGTYNGMGCTGARSEKPKPKA